MTDPEQPLPKKPSEAFRRIWEEAARSPSRFEIHVQRIAGPVWELRMGSQLMARGTWVWQVMGDLTGLNLIERSGENTYRLTKYAPAMLRSSSERVADEPDTETQSSTELRDPKIRQTKRQRPEDQSGRQ